MFRIIIETGDLKGRVFELQNKKPLYMGRAVDSDIRIDEEKVSRKHCVITLSNQRIILRDLDSTNGTYVNGFAIKEREVYPRDCIKVGSVFMTLQKDEDDIIEIGADDGIFQKMRQGKGYNTILAEMVGEAKAQDIEHIMQSKPASADTETYLRKELRKLGYTDTETSIIVKKCTGGKVESFPVEDIINEKSPKPNEKHVTLKKISPDIKASTIVSHDSKEFLVIAIISNSDGTSTCVLKSC